MLLINWKNYQEIILSSMWSYVNICMWAYIFFQWEHTKEEGPCPRGWPCIFPLCLSHYDGQRDVSSYELLPKVLLSPKGIYFLWCMLLSFFTKKKSQWIWLSTHPKSILSVNGGSFQLSLHSPLLCWFMDDHPASTASHPIKQGASTSLISRVQIAYMEPRGKSFSNKIW